ncbi:MAG: 50S ribosomal protein L1 [Theionarchaea archaeon]|nr:50S ribosomal protein L1 [Theionarchaea archaeon]MBU7038969.1 50S ribosomal protein L1 [Theionarchaea archaeon]
MEEEVKKAVQEVKNTQRNFEQSVEMTIALKDLDFKQPESRVRSEVTLPRGRGKPVRIGVFAEGDMAQRAKKLNVDVYNTGDVEDMGTNKKKAKEIADSHEFFLAQADLMPLIGRTLGPVLGRRNKMPKPHPPMAPLEPIIDRLKKTVAIDSKGQPVVHSFVGTEKMSEGDLTENAVAVLSAIERLLPRGENNIRAVYMKTTMGKPVRVM